MKQFIAILALVSLTNCGLADRAAKDCGGSFSDLCKAVLGDSPAELDAQQLQIDALQQQLETMAEQNIQQTTALQYSIDILQNQIYALRSQLTEIANNVEVLAMEQTSLAGLTQILQSQVSALQNSEVALQAQMLAVQTQVNAQIMQLAVLQGYKHISSLEDPCGNGPGFDEILLRLSSGELVAYFENGGKRHLSVLPAGSYKTTDQQACNFTVLSNGQITF